jgi:hypothetical protein
MSVYQLEAGGLRNRFVFVDIVTTIRQFDATIENYILWECRHVRITGDVPLPPGWIGLLYYMCRKWGVFPQIRELRGVTMINFSSV